MFDDAAGAIVARSTAPAMLAAIPSLWDTLTYLFYVREVLSHCVELGWMRRSRPAGAIGVSATRSRKELRGGGRARAKEDGGKVY